MEVPGDLERGFRRRNIFSAPCPPESISTLSPGGSVCSRVGRLVGRLAAVECFADRLWAPLRAAVNTPNACWLGLSLVYLVYSLLWLLWVPVALSLGEYAAWLGGLWATRSLLGTAVRFAVFPGSFSTVRRDVEREYLRRLSNRVDRAMYAIETLWIDLHPLVMMTPAASRVGMQDLEQHRAEANYAFLHVLTPLHAALNALHEFEEARGSKKDSVKTEAKDSEAPAAVEGEEEKAKLLEEEDCFGDIGRTGVQLTPRAAAAERALAFALEDVLITGSSIDDLCARILSGTTSERLGARRASNRDDAALVLRLVEASRTLSGTLPHLGAPKQEGGRVKEVLSALKSALVEPWFPPPQDTAADIALLRAELTLGYRATQFWLTAEGAQIDCCVIPPASSSQRTRRRRQHHNNGNNNHPRGVAAIPTVVFCAPNAVLYESYAMAPRDGAGWVATYSRLGFQVVVWNARGYGRSTGTPSPGRSAKDGCALVKYLRQRGVPKLLLHGESIGGMCACHVAADLSDEKEPLVDALVADRTFANLKVEAQYLTGIGVSSFFLPLLTGWWDAETDTLGSYCRARCPKLCASDAADHMIPEQASLKAGVAILAELGEKKLRQRTLSRKQSANVEMPTNSASWRLTDDNIEHFTLCVQFLASAAQRQVAPLALWHTMARIDGGCGLQLHEAATDLGMMRSWLCCRVVFPNGAKNKLIDGPINDDTKTAESEDELDQPSDLELEEVDVDEEQASARMLLEKEEQTTLDLATAVSALNRILDAYPEELSSTASSQPSKLAVASSYAVAFLGALAAKAERNEIESQGSLLVLSCGHNAPWAANERKAYLAWLRQHFDHDIAPESI